MTGEAEPALPAPGTSAATSSNDVVLEIVDVSKRYCRTLRSTRQHVRREIMGALFGRRSHPTTLGKDQFWALQDVSLTLRRGDAIGVIGANGAGKSTLLSLAGGYLLPDRGEVRVRGGVGALMDLTAGFQQNLSGRENIFIKGALQGRSRQEMRAREKEIVDFADLGDFITAPIRTYSAGMRLRLAFAIAIHMEPDLVLIDEVLAVGDFRFKQKCLSRIRALRDRTSFVLVSHSMNEIRRFCDRVIVLDGGRVAFDGLPAEAVAFYTMSNGPSTASGVGPEPLDDDDPPHPAFVGQMFHNEATVRDVEHFWSDLEGRPLDEVGTGDSVALVIRFRLIQPVHNLIIGVPIWTEDGMLLTGLSSDIEEAPLRPEIDCVNEVTLVLPQQTLNAGTYRSVVTIIDGVEFLYREENAPLKVMPRHPQAYGLVTLAHEWHMRADRRSSAA